jgi:UTP--glucose-1-phosphate uridylyltransferase
MICFGPSVAGKETPVNTTIAQEAFAPFRDKMLREGLPEIVIATFARYFEQLRQGESGMLSGQDIEPVAEVPALDEVRTSEAVRRRALERTVIIKLNGGLGTSMGMTRAKSLLPVKGDLTFLDIIARQVLALREQHGCRLPLLFMNSYRTREDTLEALQPYSALKAGLPLDFVQHKVPRVLADPLQPLDWPQDPLQEWCPPGHGDLYTALQTSGILATLLDGGYEYAFLSNSDNLGAVLDLDLLGWFAAGEIPFLMEVAERTVADKKGGHLARLRDGRLTLRESAQCPADEVDDFQNIERYRFFNTNNLWVNLKQLNEVLQQRNGVMPLPMIRNEKQVDSKDPKSPRVIQLETAMGAALSVFEKAQALRVPEQRFAPVKTTNDLLGLWSDLYELSEAYLLEPVSGRTLRDLQVDLDPAYFKSIDDFRQRFAKGAPSLKNCESLRVRGDVHFGAGQVLQGRVLIEKHGTGPRRLADGEVFSGDV